MAAKQRKPKSSFRMQRNQKCARIGRGELPTGCRLEG
jgi:hypothetical protein